MCVPVYVFLDDLRDPKTKKDIYGHFGDRALVNGWIVVRGVEDFISVIDKVAAIIEQDFYECKPITAKLELSFDHDLGEDVPTGYDAIKKMCDIIQSKKLEAAYYIVSTTEVNVHSANPVGKKNIEGYWVNFKSFITNLYNCKE